MTASSEEEMCNLKAMIGEYGKVVILALLICSTVLFLFGKGENGFLGMLGRAAPVGSVGDGDSFDIANAIATRKAPDLSVTVRKLKKGVGYNLLDADMFSIRAQNEDGETVQIIISKIVDPRKEDITEDTAAELFIPILPGEYRIAYQAFEVYKGSKKVTEKEYRFIAD